MPMYYNIITAMWPFVLVLVLFYFFLYLPQKRARERFQTMIDQLKVGHEIVTKCGTLGKIETLKYDTLIIKLHGGTTSEILKDGIMLIREQ